MIYNGHKLRVIIGDKKVLHSTSCKINVSVKLEEIASKDTDGNVVTASNYSWTISGDALVAKKATGVTTHLDTKELMQAVLGRADQVVQFTTDETGDFVFSGNAIFESCDLTADDGSSAKYSFSMKGNGDLTIADV